jgi:hypothetical protein
MAEYGLKRKAIKHIIEQKLGSWLSTVPAELADKMKGHIVVTGGAIASMLLGEQIKDYDVYLDSLELTDEVARYYVKEFNSAKPRSPEPFVNTTDGRVSIFVKSSGVASDTESDEAPYQYFENEPADGLGAREYIDQVLEAKEDVNPKFRPVFLSENAITLSNKVQIAIRFYGDPDKIHESYDYIHATNYYYNDELVLKAEALESLLSRSLIYRGSLYPVCSLFRMRKFMSRGWRISAGEIAKMAFQISELDLSDPKVLREQLIGVDAAYFHELISMLKGQSETGRPLEASYIVQLIDELSENPF